MNAKQLAEPLDLNGKSLFNGQRQYFAYDQNHHKVVIPENSYRTPDHRLLLQCVLSDRIHITDSDDPLTRFHVSHQQE